MMLLILYWAPWNGMVAIFINAELILMVLYDYPAEVVSKVLAQMWWCWKDYIAVYVTRA